MVAKVETAEKLKKLKQFDFILLKLLVAEPNVTRAELKKGVKSLYEIYGFHVPAQSEFTYRLQLLEELGFIRRTRGQTCVYSVIDTFKFCLLSLVSSYFEVWGKVRQQQTD